MRVIFAPLVVCLTGCLCAATSPKSLEAAAQRVRAEALRAGVPYPLVAPELRIHKAPHRLELWSSGKQMKRYNLGLGDRGLADKRQQGDHLTPEGRFYISSRNERSQFHLFLGLSYPNEAAITRGLKDGLITKAQHASLLQSLRNKACPAWNTRVGGAVGIHGGGSSADWTWGCIAVEDAEIEELWVACPLGSSVLIEPE